MMAIPPNHHAIFVRDDGSSVEIAARVLVEGYRLPAYVTEYEAIPADGGDPVELTESEFSRFNEQVADNYDPD